ncbi:MAG TPA: hypothetical protein VFO34_04215 [Candidatus Acidoferrales bacterium]|nr:hypothetical protein [Candidatus Acidoferrales bacterium]
MPEKMNQEHCDEFAARLESALDSRMSSAGLLETELAAHLQECENCRVTFDDAELAQKLLNWGVSPAAPSYGFSTRVMAGIRAEQARREASGSIFWRPVELLAGRFAMAAAAIVLVLSFVAYESEKPSTRSTASAEITELVPQPDTSQPQTPDDVLVSLSERPNGR